MREVNDLTVKSSPMLGFVQHVNLFVNKYHALCVNLKLESFEQCVCLCVLFSFLVVYKEKINYRKQSKGNRRDTTSIMTCFGLKQNNKKGHSYG